MKRSLLLILLISLFSYTFADQTLTGSGFYRVINKGDSRYVHVTDNTGYANATKHDLKAVQLIKNFSNAVSAAASVLYFDSKGGNSYDIQAQNTGIEKIASYIPSIYYQSRSDAYSLYVTASGATVYLGSDPSNYYAKQDTSYMETNGTGDMRLWYIKPISPTDDSNYFGIKPTVKVGDKYYAAFYADFAFSFYSTGMKAYYISDYNSSSVKLTPISQNIIPASTPVIIECSSEDPSNNRLNLYHTGGTVINDNKLKGVYFCNTLRHSTDAVTKYDSETMRVLGVTSDGKLGFVTSTEENLPANQSYLVVTSGTASTLEGLGPEEYTSIEPTFADENPKKQGVYSILGKKLRYDNNISGLPAGIYIVNGKKIIKK